MRTSMSIKSKKEVFTRRKDMPFHAIAQSREADARGLR